MPKKPVPKTFTKTAYREFNDRVHLITSNVEEFLQNHPVGEIPKFKIELEKISRKLGKLYAKSGEKC